ncbi:MAG: type transport system ATP-binding protein, partial [Acetobacteraceae bacterium]|nr:type transport system ATP-binding protein [Acetobacteraceae bacterium]
RKALDDVTLTVEQGQFTALLGLNGAGKTTLLSLVTRLFDTRTGSISVLGNRIDRDPGAALRQLGVVFQARTLDLDLSVKDNLLFHAALHGIGGREARQRMLQVLEDVSLANRKGDKARLLSGGQMRRVEIARALLHRPRLLVLDEPTVGLDVESKLAIVTHVRTLVRQHGVAVLWTTHLLDEIEPSDNVVILHQGKRMAAGLLSDVVAQTGANSLRGAFASLTGSRDAPA